MKYLKTFESYSTNENTPENTPEMTEEIKSEIEQKVEDQLSNLSPEELEELNYQLEEFASKHGLSMEDLKDSKKVEEVLKGLQGTNESWLGDKWNQFKSWIGGFLFKIGLGGFITTILGTAISTGVLTEFYGMTDVGAGKEVGPYALLGFGLSAIAVVVGHFTSSKSDKAWQGEIGSIASKSRR